MKEWYGLKFDDATTELQIEQEAYRRGGRWKKDGQTYGNGPEFHFKRMVSLLWPDFVWHLWSEMQLKLYVSHRIIVALGAASTGKSFCSAAFVLTDYYAWKGELTALVTSTTREALENRVFGEMKNLHKKAKKVYSWLPGYLIEGRQRIVTDERSQSSEGRDFRNGIMGVAVKKGQNFQGMEELVGIKSPRMRLLAEELNFMPKTFVDALSNLNKNHDFKALLNGNPKDITDALGVIAEPASHLGGWDAGIDQTGRTKTWEIRFPQGVCMQLVGTDSPNLDGQLGIPLITQKQIDADIAFYGQDSIQYSMMDLGKMPRGAAARRIITRQMCFKFHAMEDPVWEGTHRTRIGCLDAAYRGTGGDRCVFGELQFGPEAKGASAEEIASAIVSQSQPQRNLDQILALIDTTVVPIVDRPKEMPEDQIVLWVKEQCEKRGIAPENFFFDSTGRGSLMNAFGRLWSPHVNGIEFGGTASANRRIDPFVVSHTQGSTDTVLCKDYYFNMVTELWFNLSYVIQSGQFRGLTEEVMNEASMREWGFAGKKIQAEPKDKMKQKCFVGGTLVTTTRGDIPIQDIKVGDWVETPFGPSPVIELHCHTTKDLVCVDFSNGKSLTSTPSHKIFTWNGGWTTVDTLSFVSEVESVTMLPIWHLANGLFTRMIGIGFNPLVDIIRGTGTGIILKRKDFYIESFGLIGLDQFRKAWQFITSTAIGLTTAFITLGLKSNHPTKLITCGNGGAILNLGNPGRSSTQTGSQKAKNGIAQKREESGTEKTGLGTGKKESRSKERAVYAEANSHLFGRGPNSVLRNATTYLGELITEKIPEFVSGVAKLIWAIFTSHQRIVPNRVRCLTETYRSVYDLTVAHNHCYYANGILVSNSGRSPDLADCLVVGVAGAIKRGFVIKRTQSTMHKRVDHTWKRKLKERAQNHWRDGELVFK